MSLIITTHVTLELHTMTAATRTSATRTPAGRLISEQADSPATLKKVRVGKGANQTVIHVPVGKDNGLVILSSKYLESSAIDRHRFVRDGMSVGDVKRLLGSFEIITSKDLFSSLGVSDRTLQRKQADKLNAQHSNAALALLEITNLAQRVLGSHADAEHWLQKPQIALDGERPLDLISSAPGVEAVKELLTRIEYGVYA